MKITFGEYSGYTTPGGVRFMKNNKLVSENSLPPEVTSYLRRKLEGTPRGEEGVGVREDRPSEDKPREDKVPPEITDPVEEPLTASDFENTELTDEQAQEMGEEIYPVVPLDDNGEPVMPEPRNEINPDFLEQVSIHTAPLKDIVQALHERFGIYTVYLGKLPVSGEVNPLTGERFTKYHQGIAYQAAIYAQRQGILKRDPEYGRRSMDNEAAARETHRKLMNAPQEQANSFAHRTSAESTKGVPKTEIVHVTQPDGSVRAVQRVLEPQEVQRNGAGIRRVDDFGGDEPLVEPKIGGTPVIRPNW